MPIDQDSCATAYLAHLFVWFASPAVIGILPNLNEGFRYLAIRVRYMDFARVCVLSFHRSSILRVKGVAEAHFIERFAIDP